MNLLLVVAPLIAAAGVSSAAHVLIEAEQFDRPGGWLLDQQFMDLMGSPYLLAHGLGAPVDDATTRVEFPNPGAYRVWVRTRDWTAPWGAPESPGRFRVLIGGHPLETIFGTEGATWHWQDSGTIEIEKNDVEVSLHDLTGFEGRCDAILFCADPDFVPPNEPKTWQRFVRSALACPMRRTAAGLSTWP